LAVQNVMREMIRAGFIKSAHDCSEGGLAVAFAEACFNPGRLLGAEVNLDVEAAVPAAPSNNAGDTPASTPLRIDQILFNEAQSRIVISLGPENVPAATNLLEQRKIPFQKLGVVGSEALSIRTNGQLFSWAITELYDDWFNSIRNIIEDSRPASEAV
jgi:phosphoribosylformylglycinamidine synthase